MDFFRKNINVLISAYSLTGRYELHKLKIVVMLLVANDAPLPADWLEHSLIGS